MSARILKIEGRYEVIGFFQNDVLIRTTKRLVTNWK
ncbi:MAG: hypothetical protein RLZZ181_420 [Pseudomonadota bacterium]|jgi:hypothetical protein